MAEWCGETKHFLGAQHTVFTIAAFAYYKRAQRDKGWRAGQSVVLSRRESAVLSCQVARPRKTFFADAGMDIRVQRLEAQRVKKLEKREA